MQRIGKPAFTLIELLVVVGVITVLAALLFPTLARAREKGRQSLCLAQLRQLVVACGLYMEDHDQQFPPDLILGRHNLTQIEDAQGMWYLQLQPYLRSLRVLHCPSDNIGDALRATSACAPDLRNDPRLPALSYGVNQYLVMAWHQPAWQRLRTPAGISRPSQTLLFGDSSEPWTIQFCPETDPHGVRWSHVAYANGPPECREGYHGGHSGAGHERHIAGSNLAFVDGHARYMPADRFLCRIQAAHLVQRPLIWPDALSPDGD